MDVAKLTIEELKLRINNPKTKEYFDEVYSCYANGNYRTAINALYNTFLLDLFFKLEMLMHFGDEKAKKKYDSLIKKINKKTGEWDLKWEDDLRKYAYEDTSIFHYSDKSWIDYLKEQRNLCSHPSIKEDSSLLYNPLREEVQSLIKKVLCNCLVLPPLYLKDIHVELLVDISRLGFETEDKLKIYLENKYLNNISPIKYNKLLKFLWRLVVSDSDPKTIDNLKVIMTSFNIISEHKYFNDLIVDSNNHSIFDIGSCLEGREVYIINMLNQKLLNNLSAQYKMPIEQLIDMNNIHRIIAYNRDSLIEREKYIKAVSSYTSMNFDEKSIVLNILPSLKNNVFNLTSTECIALYSESATYNQADNRFNIFIRPHLAFMSRGCFMNLILESAKNNQCYDRGSAKNNHRLILKEFSELLISDQDAEEILEMDGMRDAMKKFHEKYEDYFKFTDSAPFDE